MPYCKRLSKIMRCAGMLHTQPAPASESAQLVCQHTLFMPSFVAASLLISMPFLRVTDPYLFCHAVAVRHGVNITALLCGGGQESGRRSGTENVLLLVGLGEAAALAHRDATALQQHMSSMRDRLQAGLSSAFPQVSGLLGSWLPFIITDFNIKLRSSFTLCFSLLLSCQVWCHNKYCDCLHDQLLLFARTNCLLGPRPCQHVFSTVSNAMCVGACANQRAH